MEPSRKEQVFIVTTVAVLLLGGVAFGVAQFFWMGAPPPLPASTAAISRSMTAPMVSSVQPVVPMTPDAQAKFNKTYSLAENEIIKRLPKPYIPERDMYIRSQGASSSVTPSFIVWRWDGTKVMTGVRGPSSPSFRLTLSTLMNFVATLQPSQYEVPAEFASVDYTGDYVVRQTATEEQKMQALGPIISAVAGKKVHFSKQPVDRSVVTASGQYAFKPLEDGPDNTSICLFLDKADIAADAQVSRGSMTVSDLIRSIGSLVNTQITSEVQGDVSTPVPYRIYLQSLMPVRTPGPQHDEALKKLLDNVSQQTGLTFKTETKKVEVWALVPD